MFKGLDILHATIEPARVRDAKPGESHTAQVHLSVMRVARESDERFTGAAGDFMSDDAELCAIGRAFLARAAVVLAASTRSQVFVQTGAKDTDVAITDPPAPAAPRA